MWSNGIKLYDHYFGLVKTAEPDDHKNCNQGAPPVNVIQHDKTTKAIEDSGKFVRDILLEKGIPGLTVRVARKGKTLWKSAFGICDVENQVACEHDAVMRIASISKTIFASTMVAPKLQDNTINLDTSIHDYLSVEEFPKKKYDDKESPITIGQLLSHTSGIRDYGDRNLQKYTRPIGAKRSKKVTQDDHQYNQEEFYQRKLYRSVIDALSPFKHSPLQSEPGTYHYTTYGYTLLSAVMEKIYNSQLNQNDTSSDKYEQIEDLWMNKLSSSWGLKNTKLDYPETIIPRRARYYLRTGINGELINAPVIDNSIKWAGGGLVSNTKDLIKFGNKLLSCYKGREKDLKSETIELMWKNVDQGYGLGFALQKDDPYSMETVYHTGSAVGASSILLLRPKSETVVAILTNLQGVNLFGLANSIAKHFEREDTDKPPVVN